jgi:hypothetical protein
VITLSATAIGTYLNCERQYLYSVVYRVPGEQGFAAAIGAAVHAGVEALWKSPTRPLEALRRRWDRELVHVPAGDEEPAVGLADAEMMLALYQEKVVPTFSGRPEVEVPFSIVVDGRVGVTGTLDAIDEDLRDLKTTSGKTINGRKPRFDPKRYDLQLGIYELGYEFLRGQPPRRTLLDVLTRRGTYRQYERHPSRRETLDVLEVATDGIMADRYEPTGALTGICKWCPYANGVCPDARTD